MSDPADGNGQAGLPELRTIADYQFGSGAGDALFPPAESLTIKRTSSGRPQQIHADDGRIVSFGTDGRFTLGLEGGRRLHAVLEHPAYRVVVDDESEPFVRDEKNVFTKFVLEAGPEIRPGDEVLVIHERGELIAVGTAELAAEAIADFETGMAVNVREGAPAEN
ncbi:PUA domain containing protein [Haloterrigena turkmenica DSM 5511]|uniref:PUA domain containing protein n=1 Tax=Haloterrigena turkmenica (strain ATCC 51198 / DSM 5511 / JCM 9101 / NCIMB 13204 / VKM B-1734 / 4k) TaxID=543526 RepID=D2RX82_HALTV|nr:PUA domain-containing protein [Haloterrigena turkmenica]ADB59694.1 PUA domain containing protein [Haloterrigena turkmenica DSM 5511]